VVIDVGDYDKPVASRPWLGFVEFLESLDHAGLELSREPDVEREGIGARQDLHRADISGR
jgi:hypothetical protein